MNVWEITRGCQIDKTIKTVLKKVLGCFESQNLPKAITYSVFPVANMPSSNWSLLNRILIFLSETQDARGFRQWKEVDRHEKKGAKAIHILVPRIMKCENDEGDGEERLAGFMPRPVFRIEDTEGETIEYPTVAWEGYVRMQSNGNATPPFSFRTVPDQTAYSPEKAERIRKMSRKKYGRDAWRVEEAIEKRRIFWKEKE